MDIATSSVSFSFLDFFDGDCVLVEHEALGTQYC